MLPVVILNVLEPFHQQLFRDLGAFDEAVQGRFLGQLVPGLAVDCRKTQVVYYVAAVLRGLLAMEFGVLHRLHCVLVFGHDTRLVILNQRASSAFDWLDIAGDLDQLQREMRSALLVVVCYLGYLMALVQIILLYSRQ